MPDREWRSWTSKAVQLPAGPAWGEPAAAGSASPGQHYSPGLSGSLPRVARTLSQLGKLAEKILLWELRAKGGEEPQWFLSDESRDRMGLELYKAGTQESRFLIFNALLLQIPFISIYKMKDPQCADPIMQPACKQTYLQCSVASPTPATCPWAWLREPVLLIQKGGLPRTSAAGAD